MPIACMQCEKPPCVKVCPVRTTYREADGSGGQGPAQREGRAAEETLQSGRNGHEDEERGQEPADRDMTHDGFLIWRAQLRAGARESRSGPLTRS